MPEEMAYIGYLKKHYHITVLPKYRFDLVKEFQKIASKNHQNLSFKILRNIEDPDEK